MAQATVNLASFADKLRRLESTPQSITALSKYVVYQCKGASAAANVRAMATAWLAEVTAATGDMQLVYIYLVNDVLQSSRHERPPTPALLVQGWLRVLPRALAVIGTRSLAVVPKVRRTLGIWKERAVYPPETLRALENALEDPEAILASADGGHDAGGDDAGDELLLLLAATGGGSAAAAGAAAGGGAAASGGGLSISTPSHAGSAVSRTSLSPPDPPPSGISPPTGSHRGMTAAAPSAAVASLSFRGTGTTGWETGFGSAAVEVTSASHHLPPGGDASGPLSLTRQSSSGSAFGIDDHHHHGSAAASVGGSAADGTLGGAGALTTSVSVTTTSDRILPFIEKELLPAVAASLTAAVAGASGGGAPAASCTDAEYAAVLQALSDETLVRVSDALAAWEAADLQSLLLRDAAEAALAACAGAFVVEEELGQDHDDDIFAEASAGEDDEGAAASTGAARAALLASSYAVDPRPHLAVLERHVAALRAAHEAHAALVAAIEAALAAQGNVVMATTQAPGGGEGSDASGGSSNGPITREAAVHALTQFTSGLVAASSGEAATGIISDADAAHFARTLLTASRAAKRHIEAVLASDAEAAAAEKKRARDAAAAAARAESARMDAAAAAATPSTPSLGTAASGMTITVPYLPPVKLRPHAGTPPGSPPPLRAGGPGAPFARQSSADDDDDAAFLSRAQHQRAGVAAPGFAPAAGFAGSYLPAAAPVAAPPPAYGYATGGGGAYPYAAVPAAVAPPVPAAAVGAAPPHWQQYQPAPQPQQQQYQQYQQYPAMAAPATAAPPVAAGVPSAAAAAPAGVARDARALLSAMFASAGAARPPATAAAAVHHAGGATAPVAHAGYPAHAAPPHAAGAVPGYAAAPYRAPAAAAVPVYPAASGAVPGYGAPAGAPAVQAAPSAGRGRGMTMPAWMKSGVS